MRLKFTKCLLPLLEQYMIKLNSLLLRHPYLLVLTFLEQRKAGLKFVNFTVRRSTCEETGSKQKSSHSESAMTTRSGTREDNGLKK